MSSPDGNYYLFGVTGPIYRWVSVVMTGKQKKQVEVLAAYLTHIYQASKQLKNNKTEFQHIVVQTAAAVKGKASGKVVVDELADLLKDQTLELDLVQEILNTLYKASTHRRFQTIQETQQYLSGTAESVTMLLGQLGHFSSKSIPALKKMGRALYYLELIRLTALAEEEDRQYIPLSVIRRFKLESLQKPQAKRQQTAFSRALRVEIDRCQSWLNEAEPVITSLPRSERVVIRTYLYVYRWLARELHKKPMAVFDQLLLPPPWRVGRYFIQAFMAG